MSHRAGTGDAPIPGLVTSRRNPAYKQRLAKAKEAEAAERARYIQQQQAVKAANKLAKRGRRSPSIQRSPERENSAERESREKKEEAERRAKAAREEEAAKLKLVEDEEHRRRWAEQEAKWAEERRQREEQRRQEEERKAQRQNKLRGAFSMADDEDDEEELKAKILAEKAKSSRASSRSAAPATDLVIPAGGLAAAGARKAAAENQDAISLRASLADPSGPRVHSPGEVAEHFRRISEMKRRFRRPEFGGPARKKSPSRSRSREKYNSVWIKPSGR
eukprot:TRINITY_DN41719_c0_g1_i1.p1 TRINITY_DN41719_c0_g1~~TRINITY_DN41719_c0_g1_i1.p1  ORF type:complete len:277 (-),score=67.41 TRINITY_DN41719_c0_g1_i1:102-932(-)